MIIISGIKVSLDQVKKYLQKALGMENPGCTIDRLRKDGTETLVICLTMDDALFSDEIKELEKLIIETGTALAEQAGVPVKIRLVQ